MAEIRSARSAWEGSQPRIPGLRQAPALRPDILHQRSEGLLPERTTRRPISPQQRRTTQLQARAKRHESESSSEMKFLADDAHGQPLRRALERIRKAADRFIEWFAAKVESLMMNRK